MSSKQTCIHEERIKVSAFNRYGLSPASFKGGKTQCDILYFLTFTAEIKEFERLPSSVSTENHLAQNEVNLRGIKVN